MYTREINHQTLLDKMAELDSPNHVYKWLADFFTGYSHQTDYGGFVSHAKSIPDSITSLFSHRPYLICSECF